MNKLILSSPVCSRAGDFSLDIIRKYFYNIADMYAQKCYNRNTADSKGGEEVAAYLYFYRFKVILCVGRMS